MTGVDRKGINKRNLLYDTILQRQHLKQFTISYLDLKLSLTSSSENNKNRCSLIKGKHH